MDRKAEGGGFLVIRFRNPARSGAVDRLGHIFALHRKRQVIAEEYHDVTRHQTVPASVHSLDLDRISTGLEQRVVGQPDLRDDEPILGRDMPAHVDNPAFKTRARFHHGGYEVRGEPDVDLVNV